MSILLTREVLEINSSNDGSEINGRAPGSGQRLDSCGNSHCCIVLLILSFLIQSSRVLRLIRQRTKVGGGIIQDFINVRS